MSRHSKSSLRPQKSFEESFANLNVTTSEPERPKKSSKSRSSTSNSTAKAKGKARANPTSWFSELGSEHPYKLVAMTYDPPQEVEVPKEKPKPKGKGGKKKEVPQDIIEPAESTFLKVDVFNSAAYFPWGEEAPVFIGTDHHRQEKWKKVAEEWADVVAVAGGTEVRVIRTTWKNPYELLYRIRPGTSEENLRALSWTIDTSSLAPLLCFAGDGRVIFVWDLERNRLRSSICGHGGAILHLTTHPVYPNIIASCSRDRSTRITDLNIRSDYPMQYPAWPDGRPNKASFPMGGEPTEQQSEGPGKCIAVIGWWYAGHRDAVVCADFHRTHPLIATCGYDHTVKIWPLPRLPIEEAAPSENEPKVKYHTQTMISSPLFSTARLHASPLTSIHWLSKDVLVSKSWDELDHESGICVIWQWQAFSRYFPEDDEDMLYCGQFRPETWDVNNSRLYTFIANFPIRKSQAQCTPIAIHRPFTPRETSANQVTGLLIAVPSCHVTPSDILLWNPLLEDGQNSHVPYYKDFRAEEEMSPSINEEEEPLLGGSAHLPPPNKKRRVGHEPPTPAWTPSVGWTLQSNLVSKRAGHSALMNNLMENAEDPILRAIAIRPCGARWIVGVGQGNVILIWAMEP